MNAIIITDFICDFVNAPCTVGTYTVGTLQFKCKCFPQP